MKTIWHLGAFNSTNLGDMALKQSIAKLLEGYRVRQIDAQATHFTSDIINKLNQEADLLLIGGGGLLFHRPQDNSLSGWQFSIRTEDIAKIKIPIVILAIGYNKFPNDSHQFSEYTWTNIKTVFEQSKLHSVRNAGTAKVLFDHIGISTNVIPDPAIKLDYNFTLKLNTTNNIGINWATDRPIHRYGSIEDYEKTLRTLLHLVKDTKPEANIYIIQHLIENEMNKDGKYILNNVAQSLGIQILDRSTLKSVDDLASVYSQMDLVIGARGHANIIPWGLGVPVIGFGTHNKVKWFLEEVGLSNYYCKHPESIKIFIDSIYQNYDKLKIDQKVKNVEHSKLLTNYINLIKDLI